MTSRLPPTSACAAAARRPSPVPRARVRRCPACVARSSGRAQKGRDPQEGRRVWRFAVRRCAWLLHGGLLCGGLTPTGGLVLTLAAGQAGQAWAGAAAGQGRPVSGRACPAVPSLLQQCRQERSLASAVRPPAATRTARALQQQELQPLKVCCHGSKVQQPQPQPGQQISSSCAAVL